MEMPTKKQNKLYIGIVLMVLASLCTTLGQLFWKLSNANINFELIIGFVLYVFGTVFMIVAFRFGKLSVLHPLLSIGYILSTIIGSIFLNEQISWISIIGIALIMGGVVLIGGESD
jgi:drug/metabolite transporter (DMT)-like permease